MLGERTVTFVWRCPDCSRVYDGESLPFLHVDEDRRYCSCGGRLIEGVESGGDWRYRLVIPGPLWGTSLHRQLEELLTDEVNVEVAPADHRGCYISLSD
jgi:hypothetical protein